MQLATMLSYVMLCYVIHVHALIANYVWSTKKFMIQKL